MVLASLRHDFALLDALPSPPASVKLLRLAFVRRAAEHWRSIPSRHRIDT
jgi:hypothetical protein